LNRLNIYSCIIIYTWIIIPSFWLCHEVCGLVGFVIIILLWHTYPCVYGRGLGIAKTFLFLRTFCSTTWRNRTNMYDMFCISRIYNTTLYNVQYYIYIYNSYKYLFATINAQRTKWSYIFVHEHKQTKSTILLCLFVFVYATTHACGLFSLLYHTCDILWIYRYNKITIMLGVEFLGTLVS